MPSMVQCLPSINNSDKGCRAGCGGLTRYDVTQRLWRGAGLRCRELPPILYGIVYWWCMPMAVQNGLQCFEQPSTPYNIQGVLTIPTRHLLMALVDRMISFRQLTLGQLYRSSCPTAHPVLRLSLPACDLKFGARSPEREESKSNV